jgi:hypothetical protein
MVDLKKPVKYSNYISGFIALCLFIVLPSCLLIYQCYFTPSPLNSEISTKKESSAVVNSQINEKTELRDSFFGDFTKAKVEKKKGKITLQVWDSHIKYSRSLPPSMSAVMLAGVEKLQIEYDEIWRAKSEADDRLSLYWNKNLIQASTLEKIYLGDPSTGNQLAKPSHKIVNIFNRAYVLNKLSTK